MGTCIQEFDYQSAKKARQKCEDLVDQLNEKSRDALLGAATVNLMSSVIASFFPAAAPIIGLAGIIEGSLAIDARIEESTRNAVTAAQNVFYRIARCLKADRFTTAMVELTYKKYTINDKEVKLPTDVKTKSIFDKVTNEWISPEE